MRRPYYSYSPSHQDPGYSWCYRFRRKMALSLRLSNVRLLEIFKLLLAASLGFSVRTIIDVTSGWSSGCDCQPCPSDGPADILANQDVQIQLREQFRPRNIYEVLRYDYFNSSYILNNFDDDPKINLLGHQKSDIKDIVQQTITLFNSARPKVWKVLLRDYIMYQILCFIS